MKFDLKKCPKSGFVLGYADNSILLDRFSIVNNKVLIESNNKILDIDHFFELHFFNKNEEYRILTSLDNKNVEEYVLTKNQETKESVFVQTRESLLRKQYKVGSFNKIKINSWYKFNEYDSIYVFNYRLIELI